MRMTVGDKQTKEVSAISWDFFCCEGTFGTRTGIDRIRRGDCRRSAIQTSSVVPSITVSTFHIDASYDPSAAVNSLSQERPERWSAGGRIAGRPQHWLDRMSGRLLRRAKGTFMHIKTWAAAVLLLSLPDATLAQGTPPVTSELGAAEQEFNQLGKLEVETAKQVADLQKEQQRLNEVSLMLKAAEERQSKADTALALERAAFKDKLAPFVSQVKAFEARGCHKAGVITKEERARCGAEHDELWARQEAFKAEDAALKKKEADAKAYKQGLAERRKSASEATLKNFSAYRQALNALQQVRLKKSAALQKVAQLRASCSKEQMAVMTPEAMKLKCGNVQFDGARPDLPPLGGGSIGTPKMR